MTRAEEARSELAKRGLSLNDEGAAQEQPQQQATSQQIPQQQESGGIPWSMLMGDPGLQAAKYGIGQLGHGVADVTQGLLRGQQGLHNLPYQIAKQVSPETAKHWEQGKGLGMLFRPDLNEYNVPGAEHPGTLGKMAQGLAEYLPGSVSGAALSGGVINPLASSMLGGALGGASTSGSAPLLGGAVGGSLGMVGGVGIPAAIKAFKYLKAIHPEKFEKQLVERGTEKYLKNVEKPSKNLYEMLREKTAGLLGKEIPQISEGAEDLYKSGDLGNVYRDFLKDGGYESAKKLRGQLGAEANDLFTKKKISGYLEPAQQDKLRSIYNERKTIQDYMNDILGQKKGLKETYQKANLLHRKNVVPARNAASIINNYVDTENEIINKSRLISALKNASAKNPMTKRALTKETISLNKLYEKNLKQRAEINKNKSKFITSALFGVGGMVGLNYLSNKRPETIHNYMEASQ